MRYYCLFLSRVAKLDWETYLCLKVISPAACWQQVHSQYAPRILSCTKTTLHFVLYWSHWHQANLVRMMVNFFTYSDLNQECHFPLPCLTKSVKFKTLNIIHQACGCPISETVSLCLRSLWLLISSRGIPWRNWRIVTFTLISIHLELHQKKLELSRICCQIVTKVVRHSANTTYKQTKKMNKKQKKYISSH